MSDLKYQTPEQLRSLISWCENARHNNEVLKQKKLRQIAQLQQEIYALGQKINNIGQKECWARIYLARKTDT